MSREGAAVFEIFPAFAASEGLFSSVCPPGSNTQRLAIEGLARVAAFAIPLLTVWPFLSWCPRGAPHHCESRDAQEALEGVVVPCMVGTL